MMGLERGFNKVRCVLTPKRRFNSNDIIGDQPQILSSKGLCNVSSTSSSNPKIVLLQLRRALQKKGITCSQKNYTLQGETDSIDIENSKNGGKPLTTRKVCSFQLEVCLLEGISDDTPIVGIRRKRLKGDAWVYKRVCEEVLALAAESFGTNQNEPPASNVLI